MTDGTRVRTQLSLFVPAEQGAAIEAVRRVVDPEQSRLIPAHVTLCREDELDAHSIDALAARMRASPPGALTLQFGPPERFHQHGMLLPCLHGAAPFDALRGFALGKTGLRAHAPHLTLAHPRNPKVEANELRNAEDLRAGVTIIFTHLQLIQQTDAAPWVVRQTFALGDTAN